MWRFGRKLVAVASIGGVGAAGVTLATTDDPLTAFKICTHVPLRLFRDSLTAASIAFDYQYSCLGLKEGSEEWLKTRHQVHERSAHKLQELCFRNGGIYIKLGQHVGQLEYVVPEEYVRTMRESMLKKCPVSSYDQVRRVFIKELGEPPEKVFAEFDPVPLASASLAQVHAATTHDGQKVAVKVQHTYLTDTSVVDLATVDFIVNFLHRCFPAFDYQWLVDEVRESAPKELDFLHEARNSERCVNNFKRLSPDIANSIYAPKVYWNLTTSRLLTMEFMDAAEITDVKAIKKSGMRPYDVSQLVSAAFAEMTFKHGFVHCDPHAANLMVRPLPNSSSSWWSFVLSLFRKKPQLVLLDHGLYKELDFDTRTSYAALWKALVFADEKAIKENSMKLGAGEDLYVLFAGVLTMRPWKRVIDPSVDHLAIEGNRDRSELQMYASEYIPEISELLRRLPRVILLMLKTNDCLRAVNQVLVQGSPLESFLIIGRTSSEAVLEAKRVKKEAWRLTIFVERILLEARLFAMKLALWLLFFRKALPAE